MAFQNRTVVREYPAFRVIRHRCPDGPANGYDYQIRDNDVLFRLDVGYGTYKVGSVVGFALEYNEDPIEAYRSAVERGHQTHWINACAAVISSNPPPQREVIAVEPGDVVVFQGRRFEIVKRPNRNLGLAPVISESFEESPE